MVYLEPHTVHAEHIALNTLITKDYTVDKYGAPDSSNSTHYRPVKSVCVSVHIIFLDVHVFYLFFK